MNAIVYLNGAVHLSSQQLNSSLGNHSPRRGRPVDAAKRDAIVAAAAESFFARGFTASSIEQIAADAGVSKVTIYNHFGDKRALFAAAVDRECARVRSIVTFRNLENGSIRDQLIAIGEAVMAFLSRPEMVQFERRIAADIEHHPEIAEVFLESGPYRMKSAFAAILEQAVARGEIVAPDLPLAVEQFISMCKGLGEVERRLGMPSSSEEDARRVAGAVDVFLKAYGPDHP